MSFLIYCRVPPLWGLPFRWREDMSRAYGTLPNTHSSSTPYAHDTPLNYYWGGGVTIYKKRCNPSPNQHSSWLHWPLVAFRILLEFVLENLCCWAIQGLWYNAMFVKDVLMGIPERDLLGMTVAVLQTAGYWFSALTNSTGNCAMWFIDFMKNEVL